MRAHARVLAGGRGALVDERTPVRGQLGAHALAHDAVQARSAGRVALTAVVICREPREARREVRRDALELLLRKPPRRSVYYAVVHG